MKVKLEEKYRRYYTLEELDAAKEIIRQEKEDDEFTAKDWARYAVNEALRDTGDYLVRVVTAEATTSKNYRAHDLYTSESGNMDVWIDATAKTCNGFIEVGAYLSDIWRTGADHYKEHMFISYYKKAEL